MLRMLAAGLLAVLTGCGSSAPSGTGPTTRPVSTSPVTASTAAGTTTAPGQPAYLPLQEPFSEPGVCNPDGSTREMAACILEQVIEVDRTVDRLQRRRFDAATDKAEVNAEDARWLANRSAECAAKAVGGGSIDQLKTANCLLEASQQRVETLNDVLSSGG